MTDTAPASSPVVVVARISNLTPSVTEAHVRELLGSNMDVKEIISPQPALWMACPTGRMEVIGRTEGDTLRVYAALHGAIIDGSRVNVSFVKADPSLPAAPQRRRSRSREREQRRRRRTRSASIDSQRRRARQQNRSGSRSRRRSRSPVWSGPSTNNTNAVTKDQQRARSPSPEWQ